MMKYIFVILLVVLVAAVALLGFRGDHREAAPWQWLNEMDQQQKQKPQHESSFFADGRGDRMPIPGTIHVGKPIENEYLLSGALNGRWGDGIPVPVTMGLMTRGQERYSISCTVCHGALGNGMGITSKYGLNGAANFLQDNFRKMADGEIFNTITYGKGQMMGYGANIVPEDRWAIVAYIRALQRSANATADEVPPAELKKLGVK